MSQDSLHLLDADKTLSNLGSFSMEQPKRLQSMILMKVDLRGKALAISVYAEAFGVLGELARVIAQLSDHDLLVCFELPPRVCDRNAPDIKVITSKGVGWIGPYWTSEIRVVGRKRNLPKMDGNNRSLKTR